MAYKIGESRDRRLWNKVGPYQSRVFVRIFNSLVSPQAHKPSSSEAASEDGKEASCQISSRQSNQSMDRIRAL